MNNTNIVFICVDCLREDSLRSTRTDTPFLDSLRPEGAYFSNLFSTTSTTTPSVASFMSGAYSESNGIVSLKEAELSSHVTTLAERLSSSGWNTIAKVTGPIVEETGLDRGFDSFEHRHYDEGLFGSWKQTLLDEINNLDEPYFLYIHLWDLHTPRSVPSKFDSIEFGNNPYERIVSALDRAIESIHAILSKQTVFILHGDHGESITGESNHLHGKLRGYLNYLRYEKGLDMRNAERFVNQQLSGQINDHYLEREHGSTTYDYMTNVPLLMQGPDINSGLYPEQVRQVDIYPTILDWLSITYDNAIDGQSLFPLSKLSSRVAYMRACGSVLRSKQNWIKSIRSDGYKYIEYPDREWESELYDLTNDPMEVHPISDTQKERELKEKLPNKEIRSGKNIEINDQLQALGYK